LRGNGAASARLQHYDQRLAQVLLREAGNDAGVQIV
jgi:hypothetical protein